MSPEVAELLIRHDRLLESAARNPEHPGYQQSAIAQAGDLLLIAAGLFVTPSPNLLAPQHE